MAIPPQHEFYRPVLEIIAESVAGLTHKEIVSGITGRLSLTEEDLQVMTRGGTKTKVDSHVRFVVFAARKSGLLTSSEWGRSQITPEGQEFLSRHRSNNPTAEVQQLMSRSPEGSEAANVIFADPAATPPEDMMDNLHQQLRNRLAEEVLDSLKSVPSTAFERMVVGLLEKMGYGYGLVTQRSHDGGIDGILTPDTLGLMEKVCIQAKRWSATTVGSEEIDRFVGSIERAGATKGVFITTSTFTSALKTAATAGVITTGNKSIRLIDGQELANLMIDYELGVVTEITYVVKRLDANYFAEP